MSRVLLTGATEGVDALHVVLPIRADAPELVGALLELTPPAASVVLLSERDADQAGPDAVRAGGVDRGSGHSRSVLRPSWSMQVVTDARFHLDRVRGAAELPFPSGDARVAWIDARDIAAVAERALLDGEHAGRVLELSGPQSLSLPRTAELLSRALGRPVVHRDVPVAEALAGTEGFERDLTALTFARVRAGVFAPVTDTVQQVTGRPAREFTAFLADSAPALRGAV